MHHHNQLQQGFSLIELLVYLALSTVLLLATAQLAQQWHRMLCQQAKLPLAISQLCVACSQIHADSAQLDKPERVLKNWVAASTLSKKTKKLLPVVHTIDTFSHTLRMIGTTPAVTARVQLPGCAPVVQTTSVRNRVV